MSKGPEANLWSAIRGSRPKEALLMRIENRHGTGVPDVHCLLEGLPFWLELKVAKSGVVKISPHQVAWHTAFWARGGLSFFLVKSLSSGYFHLFAGSAAVDLVQKPMSEVHGSVFRTHGELWDALRAVVIDHYSSKRVLCGPAA